MLFLDLQLGTDESSPSRFFQILYYFSIFSWVMVTLLPLLNSSIFYAISWSLIECWWLFFYSLLHSTLFLDLHLSAGDSSSYSLLFSTLFNSSSIQWWWLFFFFILCYFLIFNWVMGTLLLFMCFCMTPATAVTTIPVRLHWCQHCIECNPLLYYSKFRRTESDVLVTQCTLSTSRSLMFLG